jgi:predicted RNA binding protein YcfA (HicA-like mRNA interferase family)
MAKALTGAQVLRILVIQKGCNVLRQKGSHVRVQCGTCHTTVPVHSGETLPAGTLRAIERDLEPCLGRGWLRRR